jgi:peptidoglycan/LPS O-acetylase OafA/YrhL
MNPTNPLIAIVAIIVALLITKLISFVVKINLKPVKYTSIDGLRGYLSFFVFLHHASIYYFFLTSRNWASPPSKLFNHFGQTSVSLFFMVTGLLFFSKLIDARIKKADWLYFFVSRFLRLYPLYLVVICVMIFIAFFMTNFTLVEPPAKILMEIKHWLLFIIFDSPDINVYPDTNGIMANVAWSLKYEWIFYFSLPLLGVLFFKQRPTVLTIILFSMLAFCICYFTPIKDFYFYPFIAGLVAAVLAKNDVFLKVSQHFVSSFIIIIALFLTVYFFETAYLLMPLLLTSLAFILIAGGNTVFGLLSLTVSRQLGQLAYSIYLWHTTLLFILYMVIIGLDNVAKYGPEKYWLLSIGVGVVLICLSFITYYFVELPGINSSTAITKKIRDLNTKISGRFVRTKN